MKKTLASLGIAGVLAAGGVDASVLNETPIERVEMIKGERVEAKQIGNVVETTMSWKGEKGLKVKYDMGEPSATEKLKDKRDISILTETVEGGFKIDFILDTKPDTNVFCQQFEGYEDYDFFYQPELTQEEIEEGAERPDNVIGSYAVYHKTLKNHKIGETNYETGKAFHIYRPEVWEVDNKEATREWAELSYDKGQLCVTVGMPWLEEANYPVRVDPTFGYGTQGSSQNSIESDPHYTLFSLSENGTLDKLTATVRGNCGSSCTNASIIGAVYDSSKNLSVTTSANIDFSPSKDWRDMTAGSESISLGDYYLAVNGDYTTGSMYMYYDSSTGEDSFEDNATYPNFNDPAVPETSWTDRKYSIYATYTATPSESTVTPVLNISGDVEMSGNVIIQ